MVLLWLLLLVGFWIRNEMNFDVWFCSALQVIISFYVVVFFFSGSLFWSSYSHFFSCRNNSKNIVMDAKVGSERYIPHFAHAKIVKSFCCCCCFSALLWVVRRQPASQPNQPLNSAVWIEGIKLWGAWSTTSQVPLLHLVAFVAFTIDVGTVRCKAKRKCATTIWKKIIKHNIL